MSKRSISSKKNKQLKKSQSGLLTQVKIDTDSTVRKNNNGQNKAVGSKLE